MSKTIVNVMMTGLESFAQFATDGRIFVCAVLAVLFLPITLGVCTLMVVLLSIWYALHVHLAIGTVIVVIMAALAYLNYDWGIFRYYYYPIEEYSYRRSKYANEYELVISKEDRYIYGVSMLQALYVFLLGAHIRFFNEMCIKRKLEWRSCRRLNPGEYPRDNSIVYKILTGIAWSWPAYIALGIGVLMAMAYFVNTLVFGSADTFVSDIIHGPWLYLAGK